MRQESNYSSYESRHWRSYRRTNLLKTSPSKVFTHSSKLWTNKYVQLTRVQIGKFSTVGSSTTFFDWMFQFIVVLVVFCCSFHNCDNSWNLIVYCSYDFDNYCDTLLVDTFTGRNYGDFPNFRVVRESLSLREFLPAKICTFNNN